MRITTEKGLYCEYETLLCNFTQFNYGHGSKQYSKKRIKEWEINLVTYFSDEEENGAYLIGGEGIVKTKSTVNGGLGEEELDAVMIKLQVVESMLTREVDYRHRVSS